MGVIRGRRHVSACHCRAGACLRPPGRATLSWMTRKGRYPPKAEQEQDLSATANPSGPSGAARKGRARVTRSTRGKLEQGQSVKALKTRIKKLQSLLDVAKAMTAERDLDVLLELILHEAVSVVDADRCTLWIVDRESGELWTKVAHGLGQDETIRIPIGVGIAGQVAQTGEIINIPDAYADARFNREVDKKTGYRTRNILAVPMRYTTGEVTGVVQALNRNDGEAFTAEDEELLLALGANAAAAIENAILYEEIDKLFEGFVRASVIAIESRDPTTSGHSERVAVLTVGIAENLERLDTGPYAEVALSREDLQELRYAALLHDFGKVGVRESVLVKAEKLFPNEMNSIEARFRELRTQRQNAYLRAVINHLERGETVPDELQQKLHEDLQELDAFITFIRRCNRPTVLEEGGFERLRDIAERALENIDGEHVPLLTSEELRRLSIPRGSLDPSERKEIESHVTHTYRFLQQIPWTRNLRRVPEIAYAHHEKLDGGGYPRQLQADAIPLQSRIITVADIYDALTASDRPYKKAVPHERALDILSYEAKAGKIEQSLLDVFIEAKVHQHLTGGQT